MKVTGQDLHIGGDDSDSDSPRDETEWALIQQTPLSPAGDKLDADDASDTSAATGKGSQASTVIPDDDAVKGSSNGSSDAMPAPSATVSGTTRTPSTAATAGARSNSKSTKQHSSSALKSRFACMKASAGRKVSAASTAVSNTAAAAASATAAASRATAAHLAEGGRCVLRLLRALAMLLLGGSTPGTYSFLRAGFLVGLVGTFVALTLAGPRVPFTTSFGAASTRGATTGASVLGATNVNVPGTCFADGAVGLDGADNVWSWRGLQQQHQRTEELLRRVTQLEEQVQQQDLTIQNNAAEVAMVRQAAKKSSKKFKELNRHLRRLNNKKQIKQKGKHGKHRNNFKKHQEQEHDEIPGGDLHLEENVSSMPIPTSFVDSIVLRLIGLVIPQCAPLSASPDTTLASHNKQCTAELLLDADFIWELYQSMGGGSGGGPPAPEMGSAGAPESWASSAGEGTAEAGENPEATDRQVEEDGEESEATHGDDASGDVEVLVMAQLADLQERVTAAIGEVNKRITLLDERQSGETHETYETLAKEHAVTREAVTAAQNALKASTAELKQVKREVNNVRKTLAAKGGPSGAASDNEAMSALEVRVDAVQADLTPLHVAHDELTRTQKMMSHTLQDVVDRLNELERRPPHQGVDVIGRLKDEFEQWKRDSFSIFEW